MGQKLTRTAQLFLVFDLTRTKLPAERLEPLLAKTAVASLLLVTDASRPTPVEILQPLVTTGQQHGCAVLIANDASLAKKLSADGVHLSPGDQPLVDRYTEARETIGNNAIVGIDANGSRHDAMALAEAGADYIAFGLDSFEGDEQQARDRQHEQIAWWAEIFEPPVVALDVTDNEMSRDLAAVGTDFIARTLPAGLSTAELQEWLIATHEALSAATHCD